MWGGRVHRPRVVRIEATRAPLEWSEPVGFRGELCYDVFGES